MDDELKKSIAEWMRKQEMPQAVCQFGKTLYDSRIFDNLYRVWGDSDGGTIITAYWDGELKAFKINVGYHIIQQLINDNQIGSLCNYDWKEIDLLKIKMSAINDEQLYKEFDTDPEMLEMLKKWQSEVEFKPYYSRKYYLDIALKIPYTSVRGLINNANEIKEWLEGGNTLL